MADSPGGDRHSVAHSADLITDPNELAHREARNALRQFDTVIELVEQWLQPDRPFKLRPSTLLQLHRIVLDGISAYAGNFRPAGIAIEGSQHEPVGAHLVPEMVKELCDYVNDNWTTKSAPPPLRLRHVAPQLDPPVHRRQRPDRAGAVVPGAVRTPRVPASRTQYDP
jgi:Fic family protein